MHALQSRNKPCKPRQPVVAENPGQTPVDTAGSICIDTEALIFMRFSIKGNVPRHERTHAGDKS